ncbi:MOSC domain-containing protein [Sulfurimonas sp.]|jgi:MOSC domain-containing protein YiiM|uniref:MOSC domain-containing protein n=1 Tax=Sulfurimonas sp. TaxID=2022749 RepID=UPI002A361463|nr:MOSC domain-containing protein [Sulfurimonas sp.]MDY0123664.1 MOSC domain-containing protein [Sulfurimonas sp.]
MSQKLANILQLKIGKVTKNKKLTSDKEFESGIKKYPIDSAFMTKTGFRGDEVADLIHHGGETKAVLFFSAKTYEKLNRLSGNSFTHDDVAHYGENLLVDSIDESDMCVGDILKVGDATFEVSQPRQPCWKLSTNTATKPMTSIIYNNGLTGWYARVLQEGELKKGDEVILIKRVYPELSIEALNRVIVDPFSDKEVTLQAIKCPVLGEQFRDSLEGRAKLNDPKNEPFWYHNEPQE